VTVLVQQSPSGLVAYVDVEVPPGGDLRAEWVPGWAASGCIHRPRKFVSTGLEIMSSVG
jgi:hypothetical protein